jgi:predicted  nucleic acid-binding Zn-ribbon protein
MLVWAASERVRLQSAEALRDGHLITVRRLEREMDDLRASAEQCARDLRDLRARRDDLDSELRRIRSSRVHRVAQHVSDVIAGVRARGSRRTP